MLRPGQSLSLSACAAATIFHSIERAAAVGIDELGFALGEVPRHREPSLFEGRG